MVFLQMVPSTTLTASSLEELFAKAAKELTRVQFNPRSLGTAVTKELKLCAADIEHLLHRFLSELIFLKDKERFLGKTFKVKINLKSHRVSLQARIKGSRLTAQPTEAGIDVKGIAWHKFKVTSVGKGWQASFVMDV